MKSNVKKLGFTIVELLTVMSVIVILLSLLLPSLTLVRRQARVVGQKNQFRNIDSGLQLYESDFDEYPDSYPVDADGNPYYGTMKLGEIMAGQDGLGFHLDSRLTAVDGTGQDELYPNDPPPSPYPDWYLQNLRSRKEYMSLGEVEICSLTDLYGPNPTGSGVPPDPDEIAMLCDVFRSVRNRRTGKLMGMPVLYYRANPSKMLHDVNDPTNPENTFNYLDNHGFLDGGLPWNPTEDHPLWKTADGQEGEEFYRLTLGDMAVPIERPQNKDSYILISAGWDGIYGTRDDVFNFTD
jgi:prepilin-type N-terminal cleavage/methylation domain-containing protein